MGTGAFPNSRTNADSALSRPFVLPFLADATRGGERKVREGGNGNERRRIKIPVFLSLEGLEGRGGTGSLLAQRGRRAAVSPVNGKGSVLYTHLRRSRTYGGVKTAGQRFARRVPGASCMYMYCSDTTAQQRQVEKKFRVLRVFVAVARRKNRNRRRHRRR